MNVRLTTPHVVIDELPSWCGGALYDSETDAVLLRVRYGDTADSLPMSTDEARALVEALSQCLTAAERAAKVLDVPA